MNLKPDLAEELKNVKTVTIAGHIRPDGDAVGSCMGLYLYFKRKLAGAGPEGLSGRDTGILLPP